MADTDNRPPRSTYLLLTYLLNYVFYGLGACYRKDTNELLVVRDQGKVSIILF